MIYYVSMQIELPINRITVRVTLIKQRRMRRISLRINRRGQVVVRLPYYTSFASASRWVYTQRDWIAKTLATLPPPPTQPHHHSRHEYMLHKADALRLVRKYLAELNTHYHFTYQKVTIRNQSSRWGSCSRAGNLSFNYKIVFLTPEQQCYIVAHELCHLREMNHSASFWALVARSVPEYRIIRRELRQIPV